MVECGVADRLEMGVKASSCSRCASSLTCCQASSLVNSVRTRSEKFDRGNAGIRPSLAARVFYREHLRQIVASIGAPILSPQAANQQVSEPQPLQRPERVTSQVGMRIRS